MRSRQFGFVVASVGLIGALALAAPAGAQGRGVPKQVEIGVKYVFMHDNGLSAPLGFEFDAQKVVFGGGKDLGVGLQGDFGVSHFSSGTESSTDSRSQHAGQHLHVPLTPSRTTQARFRREMGFRLARLTATLIQF